MALTLVYVLIIFHNILLPNPKEEKKKIHNLKGCNLEKLSLCNRLLSMCREEEDFPKINYSKGKR